MTLISGKTVLAQSDFGKRRPLRPALAGAVVVLALLALGGCARIGLQQVGKGEAPIVVGPSVRNNLTPLEGAFACMADQIATSRKPTLMIGVGEIKDFTGKYNINEGNAITQGGSLMVYSALGKLDGTVKIAERFDTRIGEQELGYMDRRQLGDGQPHKVGTGGKQELVPWIPYYGGSILRSDYYIVGGITELNYNVASGGAEFRINQVGPKARTFTESIAVDLRIVNSRTLAVVKTVSLQKQLTGYEVGFNVFRFFDSDLFDVNIGSKAEEPLQLGIRTTLEEATLELVATVAGQPVAGCLAAAQSPYVSGKPASALRKMTVENHGRIAREQAAASARVDAVRDDGLVNESGGMTYQLQNTGGAGSSTYRIPFDFGSTDLGGVALPTLDRVALAAKKGGADIMIVAPDNENWDPNKRAALVNQRIGVVVTALAARGIPAQAVGVTWRPSPTDNGITRDGAGYQQVARLHVGGG